MNLPSFYGRMSGKTTNSDSPWTLSEDVFWTKFKEARDKKSIMTIDTPIVALYGLAGDHAYTVKDVVEATKTNG